jgi:cellulose synthase/poly-beta-1,6-N-acetylglucosamine synthase-like glycosyltransferase
VIDEVSSVRLVLQVVFWGAVGGVLYPYFGYPLLLWLLGGRRRELVETDDAALPTVSMIVPVHNEASRLLRKIENTAALSYPAEKLEILFVSDGSTDDTVDFLRAHATPTMTVIPLPVRRGKASALNAGLAHARHDVLVFTDAAIELEPDSLRRLVGRFADPEIGCVSGEDRIAGSGGEAWYGRYELMLRRLESQVHSIVGASGSFYAQRRALCAPFAEGQAPDFLSVLRTVEQGSRAVTAPNAVGAMTSLKDPRQEFERKVRTLIRGMTTLFAHAHLLNPLRYGRFSFVLFSHKVMRWLAPFFLVLALVSPLGLLDSPWYAAAFGIQVLFYLGALAALAELPLIHGSLPGKIALYFSSVNAAILAAWFRYGSGVRQEIWTPTRR